MVVDGQAGGEDALAVCRSCTQRILSLLSRGLGLRSPAQHGPRFVNIDRDTPLLLAPNLRDWLPANHLVHFILDAVDQAAHEKKLAQRQERKERGERIRGPGPTAPSAQLKASEKYNFTDAQSRIMKAGRGITVSKRTTRKRQWKWRAG